MLIALDIKTTQSFPFRFVEQILQKQYISHHFKFYHTLRQEVKVRVISALGGAVVVVVVVVV
jgi:hypothetical protein